MATHVVVLSEQLRSDAGGAVVAEPIVDLLDQYQQRGVLCGPAARGGSVTREPVVIAGSRHPQDTTVESNVELRVGCLLRSDIPIDLYRSA
jgi:hypothetical protein